MNLFIFCLWCCFPFHHIFINTSFHFNLSFSLSLYICFSLSLFISYGLSLKLILTPLLNLNGQLCGVIGVIWSPWNSCGVTLRLNSQLPFTTPSFLFYFAFFFKDTPPPPSHPLVCYPSCPTVQQSPNQNRVGQIKKVFSASLAYITEQ